MTFLGSHFRKGFQNPLNVTNDGFDNLAPLNKYAPWKQK